MTDENVKQDPAPRAGRSGNSRKTRLGIGAALLLGIGAAGGALVSMAGNSWAHGGLGRFGGHGGHHGPIDESVMVERAGAKLERLMEVVDATDEQVAQAKPIVDELVTEVYPLVQQHREHRQALFQVLTGDELSRESIEAIRSAEMDLLDRATSAFADAAVELGAVLTEEQRAKLARIARPHRRGG